MEIKLTIPKQFETHFNMDSFKDSLKRIAFDIKEYIKLKDSNPDVIPLSGLYEKELADALPHMFENAEIDYSEVETAELRQGVKKHCTIPTSSAKNPCSSSSKTQLHNANASWSKTSPTIPIRSKNNLEKTIP